MKMYIYLLFLLMFGMGLYVQEQPLYNVNIDGKQQLENAIIEAKKSEKHILVQVGGNWCPWCIKFHKFITNVASIDSIIQSNYIYIPLNYSRENKNIEALKQLEYPQRFGFPVLVVLDATGKRIHTQDSGLLEKGNSYDTSKVITFLKQWTPKALSHSNYEKN